MFISCPKDVIYLLPALPSRFASGKLEGVRTFGGFVVERLAFRNGKVEECRIRSEAGGRLSVSAGGKLWQIETQKNQTYCVTESGLVPCGERECVR